MIIHNVQFDRRLANAVLAGPGECCAISSTAAESKVVAAGISESKKHHEEANDENTVGDIAGHEVHIEALLNKAVAGIDRLTAELELPVREFQTLAVRLAGMIVRQLVGTDEAVRSQRLTRLLEDIVQRPETPVQILVNPADLQTLDTCLRDHPKMDEKSHAKSDDTIEIGECRVVYDTHELISSVESQLPDIEYRLLEVLRDE